MSYKSKCKSYLDKQAHLQDTTIINSLFSPETFVNLHDWNNVKTSFFVSTKNNSTVVLTPAVKHWVLTVKIFINIYSSQNKKCET